ncbi:acetylcholine receptor beta, putative [Schistosoma mansoni]|uniref:acetylcholine receptor beta, putative n=1 Tax=Schistosoma mansoni TaxID=6183 RepID=UPI00022C81CB|nr:acetylcholine receptor beta, putative [Schistosoma mansoni]|eukprot:XP_018644232.1 acetylcholine receptor beta, putative [Schistosoma mansoni]
MPFQFIIYFYILFYIKKIDSNNQWINSIYNNKSIISNYSNRTINQQYSRSFYKLSLINNTNNHLNKIDSSYSNLNLNWEFKQNQITTDWAEKRLIKDLLYDYEKQSRPVVDNLTPKIYVTNTQITQQITVEFGLELLQILDLDEMDQILTTSVRSLYVSEIIFIYQKKFCRDFSISKIKIMSQLKLEHQGKPGSTGRPFRPIVRLLSSAHPRFPTRKIRTQDLLVSRQSINR